MSRHTVIEFTCDQCGETAIPPLDGWMIVASLDVANSEEPKHFCSARCVGAHHSTEADAVVVDVTVRICGVCRHTSLSHGEAGCKRSNCECPATVDDIRRAA